MLDKMLGYQQTNRSVPEDFGRLLTLVNIEQHLANIRADQILYQRDARTAWQSK